MPESRAPKGEEWQHPAGNNGFWVLGVTPRFIFFSELGNVLLGRVTRPGTTCGGVGATAPRNCASGTLCEVDARAFPRGSPGKHQGGYIG